MSKKLSERLKDISELEGYEPGGFVALADDLIKQAEELEATKEEYVSILPRLDFFNEHRGYYSSMPFIPQDFYFDHKAVSRPNHPTIDVYHKEGYGITKMSSGKWLFSRLPDPKNPDEPKFEMEFTINNAFEAFMILKAIGISVPGIKIASDDPEDYCPKCDIELSAEEKEKRECHVCGETWIVTEEEEE